MWAASQKVKGQGGGVRWGACMPAAHVPTCRAANLGCAAAAAAAAAPAFADAAAVAAAAAPADTAGDRPHNSKAS